MFAEQRYREGAFWCDLCHQRWPLSHRRTQTGGLRVGVLCCYEVEDEIDRDLRRARAAVIAARLSAEEIAKPLRGPDGQFYPGLQTFVDGAGGEAFVTDITSASGVSFTVSPIALSRGGVSGTISITGGGLDPAGTFGTVVSSITWPSGVSINSTVSVADALAKYTLATTGGAPTGLQAVTFNLSDGNALVFQSVFSIR